MVVYCREPPHGVRLKNELRRRTGEFSTARSGENAGADDTWLRRARDSIARHLRGLAKRLTDDYDAVRAAVTLAWSNGPVEGQINRQKTLKRHMSGWASLDLLERRFLLAA